MSKLIWTRVDSAGKLPAFRFKVLNSFLKFSRFKGPDTVQERNDGTVGTDGTVGNTAHFAFTPRFRQLCRFHKSAPSASSVTIFKRSSVSSGLQTCTESFRSNFYHYSQYSNYSCMFLLLPFTVLSLDSGCGLCRYPEADQRFAESLICSSCPLLYKPMA